jgi:beta-lactamase regulating signal transducer with metallopeptidase domain
MTFAWILYVLLVGTLLAVAAAAVASALELAGRATRWAWCSALIATVVLALAAPAVARREIAPTPMIAAVSTPAARIEAPSGWWSAMNTTRVVIESAAVRAITLAGTHVPSAVRWPAIIGWIAASVLLLAVYLLVNVRLSLARRRWPTHTLQGTTVRVAPAAGPAVIGMVRAEIVVPRSLLERSADEQRLIIDHEQEHLRAGDHLLLGAACLAVILMPWHPAVWYLLARLRLAIELDCDARVLRRGAAPRSYGALLIDMAAHGAGIRVGTLALADRPSHLERRLLAMRSTRSRFVLLRVGALGAGAALLVLAACEARVPTAADVASMDVASAQKRAADAGLMRTPEGATTDFFVNGVKVSAAEARAMEAKIIGSIEVVKSELPTGRDTIYVTTVDRMSKERELAVAAGGEPESGGTERTLINKIQSNPNEKMVAHVENELAKVRVDRLVTVPDGKQVTRVRSLQGSGDQPVFMIDGKQVSSEEFAAVRGEDVASINVYKGESALRVSSDPAAKNGVILAKMKAKKP